jgi:autotransporter-associated beta strand protein
MKRIVLSVFCLVSVLFINATSPKIGADRSMHAESASVQRDSSNAAGNDAAPLADQFFAGDGSALTAAKWGPNGGPYTLAFSNGNVANFNVPDGTGSGAGGITVAGIVATENFTYTSPSGTLLTGGTVAPITVSAGRTLNLGSLAISTAAGTGFTKNGAGAFLTSGSAYSGGFTLNQGTLVAGGINAMGGGATNALTINGGTIAASADRIFTNKYPNGITVNGNFQFGESSANVPSSSSIANLTFNNNVALGAATRTVNIGADGTYTLNAIISGGVGSGLTITNALGATGILALTGANTYTGPTTLSGGVLSIATVANGGLNSSLGASTNAASNLVFDGGTLRYTGTNASTNRNFTINSGKTATIEVVANDLTLTGASTATNGGLTKTGTGVLNLSGTNLYTGDTVINAGGALALIDSGSIANSQVIEIKGGGFFDVSSLTTALTLANGQALKASGTTTSGTIATVSGKGLTTAADSPLQFTAFNGATAPLTIQGSGTVTVASGNPVTVNTTSALGIGDYTLIAKGATGTVAGTAPTALTIGGSGLAAGTAGSLVIMGSQLVLHVAAGDTTPPDTSFVMTEPDPTNDATGDFTFSSTEAGTFECSVDGGAFAACPTPFATASLADGPHTLAVRAIDAALNIDPTPASYMWTVDTAAPQTTIDTMPTDPSSDATGDFTFSSSEAGTFECSVDGAAFAGCTSPFATASLANGPHTFAVRATDAAGNTDATPASFAWTVSAGGSFSGTLNVGTGEAITSLTNPGGLFDQMNAGTISGNVAVNITSNLTAETGTVALNQQVETGAGNWSIFFQASGAARLIEGGNATALITLNGADRVTFSGVAFGPGGLTFRNTGDGSTFRIVNDAKFDSIVGCAVEGGTVSNVSGVVFIGNGPVSGNDNISITDSTIRDRTAPAGVPVNLIYNDGSGGSTTNSNTTITNNQLINYTQTGIFNAAADNLTISGNAISQTSARTTGLFGIQILLTDGSTVSQNSIRDHNTTSSFVGLNLQSTSGIAMISANRIFNIDNSTGSSVPFAGVQMSGSSPMSAVTIVNNMISVVPSTPGSQFIFGVHDARTAGSIDMNYNSVLLGGTAAGTNSWAFRRDAGSSTTVSLTGNVLFNDRIGVGVDNFAIGDESGGLGSWSSDHNIFVGTGSTPASFFDYGGAAVDFAAWKTGPPARDANSIASVANAGPFNVGNMFSSPNDLHLGTIGNNPAINAGTDIGLSVDIDGQGRPIGSAPDIGADEATSAPTAADASISGRVATADGRGIRGVHVVVMGGDLTEPRVVVTSPFGYYRIDGLHAGETYLVSASGKRYVFDSPVRLISLGEDAAGVDFVGERR